VSDSIDHAVGVMVLAKPGDKVREGQPLLELHHRGGRGVEAALRMCDEAVAIVDAPPPPRPTVIGEVR
jgi:thymidine phosphorylase